MHCIYMYTGIYTGGTCEQYVPSTVHLQWRVATLQRHATMLYTVWARQVAVFRGRQAYLISDHTYRRFKLFTMP